MNYHWRIIHKKGNDMTGNLAQILATITAESTQNKCAVCKAIKIMDEETREAFIDVMNSGATIKAIVDALVGENVQITRFQLAETRRECVKGAKDCHTFKGAKK